MTIHQNSSNKASLQDKFCAYLLKNSDISPDKLDEVLDYFHVRKIKKGNYILTEGEVCRLNNFIVMGAFRMFLVDKNFKEYNIQFTFENWWIGDPKSYFKREISNVNIEALENSIVYSISLDKQNALLERFPTLNTLFRKLVENAFINTQTRVAQLISSTAMERYKDFLITYPNYVDRLPNQHIASYIGVTPEFFSKLKKEYWSKQKSA